jgi:hypothetical protein
MALDHDSGQMEGRVLKGEFTGRTLSSLSDEELLLLLDELRGSDEQGVVLIEAYFDRRAQGGARARRGRREEPRRRSTRVGA